MVQCTPPCAGFGCEQCQPVGRVREKSPLVNSADRGGKCQKVDIHTPLAECPAFPNMSEGSGCNGSIGGGTPTPTPKGLHTDASIKIELNSTAANDPVLDAIAALKTNLSQTIDQKIDPIQNAIKHLEQKRTIYTLQ